MTRTEQTTFVAELAQSILEDVYSVIQNEDIPTEWDGLELRLYLAEKFNRSVVRMNRTRQNDYNNILLTTNL